LSQLTQLPVLHLLLPHQQFQYLKFVDWVDLKKIHPNQVKITLIEASERILPALSDKTAEHSAKVDAMLINFFNAVLS
jgi:hypothetical protein